MNRILFALALSVVGSTVVACATEPELTDLDPSKEWGELSVDEQAEYCDDAQAYVEETITLQGWLDVWCLGQAHGYANQNHGGDQQQSAETCQRVWEECRDLQRPSTLDFCPGIFPGDVCSATVGELSECSIDVFESFEELTSLRCADLTFGEGQGLPLDLSCYFDAADTCEE